MIRQDITKEQCLRAMEATKSVRAASRYLGLSYTHVKKWMKFYEATEPEYANLFDQHKNQQGKGIKKFLPNKKKDPALLDIIEGRIPHHSFTADKIKQRMISEGFLEDVCYKCGFNERRVLDYKVPLIFNYKDKNKHNYNLGNVELLCYNCYFLYIDNVFTDKQIDGMEDYKPIYKSKVDWEIDEYHMERLKELGLDQEEEEYDIVVKRLNEKT
jgi:hypothetical protein